MFLSLNLCIVVLLTRVKWIEALRRLSFINPGSSVPNYSFHNRLQDSTSRKLTKNVNALQNNPKYHHSKLLATTTVDKEEPSNNSRLSDFLTFSNYLDTRYILSDEILNLSKEESIGRQIEHKRLSQQTVKNMKRGIAIGLSAVALGVLYKFASYLKVFIEQQFQSLTSGRPAPQ